MTLLTNEARAMTHAKLEAGRAALGRRLFGGVWLGCLLMTGCAFTSKGEALSPRYFSPGIGPARPSSVEDAAPSSGETAPPAQARTPGDVAQTPELRVGRIEPAAHLEERIAYRVSDNELAYYEDRRWTEPPEQFVRRALDRELFESRAFRRVVAGAAPTLDVEVLSFEELRQAAPRARLTLLISLRDQRHALLERTISVEMPLELGGGADAGPALAAAMASALSSATRQIAEQVGAELSSQPASSVAAHQDP